MRSMDEEVAPQAIADLRQQGNPNPNRFCC